MQAQPNKARLEAKDDQKYREKLLARAKIIADSANRLWRKSADECRPELRFGVANRRQRMKCDKSWRRNEVPPRSTDSCQQDLLAAPEPTPLSQCGLRFR